MGFARTVFLVLAAFGLFYWFYAEELRTCQPGPTALQIELPH